MNETNCCFPEAYDLFEGKKKNSKTLKCILLKGKYNGLHKHQRQVPNLDIRLALRNRRSWPKEERDDHVLFSIPEDSVFLGHDGSEV